jgi:tetratricopeptide (TPR) repeat protein
MEIHPRKELLEGLRSLGRADRRLLRHLATCTSCQWRLAALSNPDDLAPVVPIRPSSPDGYEGVFERSWSVVAEWLSSLELERIDAPRLFAELVARPGGQRELVLRNLRRFHSWGLFELLIERSLKTSIDDPSLGEELGLLALRLSDVLPAERCHAGSLEDFRARAWAHVGNARRIRSDLRGAGEAFRYAWKHHERGSDDLLERAILLDLDASLCRAERRFDDAIRLLRQAVPLFLRLGERHRAGRSLINLSTVYQHSGKPNEGIPLLHQALEMIDPGQEPRLTLLIRHNLVDCLATSGRFREAQRASRDARPLYQSFPDARLQNRRQWVEGKIARGLGQLERAESLFLAAQGGFLAEGIAYETALVSLELVLLYAEQRRMDEAKRLAAESLSIFASRQIHREALAALAILRRAM